MNNQKVIIETKDGTVKLTETEIIFRGKTLIRLNEIEECHMYVQPAIASLKEGELGGIQIIINPIKGEQFIKLRLPKVYSFWASSLLATTQQTAYTQRWIDAINNQIRIQKQGAITLVSLKCSRCGADLDASLKCSHCGLQHKTA